MLHTPVFILNQQEDEDNEQTSLTNEEVRELEADEYFSTMEAAFEDAMFPCQW